MYIDRTVYPGGASEGREERERRCYELLDALRIPYSRCDHEHADTIEACHGIEKVLGCGICKNLFLTNRQQTDFYLLLMPGDKPFKTKLLSKQINSARLSFADSGHMQALLGLTPGSVSVLGLMNDSDGRVSLLIDRELLRDEYLGCHPCLNTSTVKLKMSDVIDKLLPALHHAPQYIDLPWSETEVP